MAVHHCLALMERLGLRDGLGDLLRSMLSFPWGLLYEVRTCMAEGHGVVRDRVANSSLWKLRGRRKGEVSVLSSRHPGLVPHSAVALNKVEFLEAALVIITAMIPSLVSLPTSIPQLVVCGTPVLPNSGGSRGREARCGSFENPCPEHRIALRPLKPQL